VTPGWVAAAVLVTALVVVLTLLVLRLLAAVEKLEGTVARQHRTISRLQRDGTGSAGPRGSSPSSLLVLLEPEVSTHRTLAADIRAQGGLPVGLPARVRVADSESGRALVAHFPLPVEFEQRTQLMTSEAPSALLLDAAGQVIGGGSPTSVAELRSLVGDARR
jgi:hypothetical protein